MRTPLEIAFQLDELLKRSKPFRNFNEVFGLTEELITTLSPSKALVEEVVVEEPVVDTEQNVLVKNEEGIFEEITLVEETVVEEPTVEEIVEETVKEEPVVAKKSTKKK